MHNRLGHITRKISAMAILIVMALSFQIYSQPAKSNPPYSTNAADSFDPSSITVSLITCYPGPEIYELCGHSAIRVRGAGIDSVWNYGIFDFNQPNFVYRFVKGETDYRGASYPFRWFLPEYVKSGRRVVEQDLNLTPDEAKNLLKILRKSVLPENAVYRYNYIKDNCSLRILNAMDSATEIKIIYPDSIRYGTYRNEMRAYHEKYPWYQFGIDLALGSGLDQKTSNREEMFVPMEVMRNAESAHFEDGRPLVKATRVLSPGKGDVTLPPTPWYLAPIFWAWLLTLGIACVVAWNIMNQKLWTPIYAVWFVMLGLSGCLVAFLVFISVHESTSPNVLIFWLNPFQLLFAFSIGLRKLKVLSLTLAYYNIAAVGVLLIITPFIRQSFNPAFYPLMLATFALACSYAIIRKKSSYKRR